jgi:Arc/MetJ-type ribon-helix-helix transcriptional regulator
MSTDSSFSPDIAHLIQQEFSHGRYGSEQELLVEAVRLLGERDRLRDAVKAGDQQLADGEFTEYDPKALRRRFDELKAGRTFDAKRES